MKSSPCLPSKRGHPWRAGVVALACVGLLAWTTGAIEAAPKKGPATKPAAAKKKVPRKSKAEARKEAAMASHVAHAALKRGEFAKASSFYKEAWKLDSSVLGYLFSSARSAHRGGDLETAETDYSEFLALNKGKKSKLFDKTRGYLLEVRKAREVVMKEKLAKTQAENAALKAKQEAADAVEKAAAKKAAAAPPVVANAPAPAGASTAAWVALGGGALLAVVGGSMYAIAASQATDLAAKLQQKDANGKIIGIKEAAAKAEVADIESSKTIAAVMGGASVLALGVGAWLWVSAPEAAVAFAPSADGRGLTLSLRF